MKDKPGDLAAGEALALEGGRLAARPGPDLYLYTFPLAGGAWPEVGRRGEFSLDGQVWPARLTDRRGPQVSLTLASGKPLNPALSGRMRFRVPAEPDLNPPPGRPAPPGAALFLDPREGWLWSATEAAGHKESLYTPESWPRAPRQTLPDRLSAGGLTFIWRQEPDPGDETPRELVEYFRRTYGRVLVVGDRPGDLEPLAGLPGALFPGDPPPDSPLGPVALHAQIERLKEVRELKLAEGRRRLAGLKGEEAAVRARLNQWTDLDDLETRFQTLGQEVEGHRREWAQARSDLAARRSAWEEAARVVEGRTRGLLGRLRQKPEAKSLKALEDHRQALASAETAVSSVRREEETALAEARRLEERLSRLRREAEGWPAREALTAELDRLAGEQKPAADLLAAESARAGPDPGRLLAEAELILALAPDLEPGEPLAGSLFPAVVRLAALRPGPRDRRALAALVLNAEKHLAILGDFTFWPVWNGRAPDLPERPGEPAWLGLKVAEEESAEKEFLAAGGLFRSERPPAFAPRLARLELGRANSDTAPEEPRPAPAASKRENRKTPRSRGWGRPPGSAGCGLGLRAFGEMGPVNPISALAAARAALNFARARPAGPGPAALILTASPAQGRLVGLMVQDLGAPPGLIFAGEPQDFRGWPKAPLVILEPAFEAPHLSHPWAWPSFGRWRLQPAWELAGEHIWLAGREAWLGRLP
ncbi:MAG: hypothetical protein LBV21_04555, partial [Candidatus Adiutrix sp.]|nr:hypothetical protein [Candidatus Adiutrix sp.]